VVLFGTHGFGATMLVWLLSSMAGIGGELWASSSVTFVLGASAGNYGLIGLWAKGQLDRSMVSALPKRERIKTLGVLLLLVPGALTPVSAFGARTAVFAHVAGFLAGFLLGHVFARRVRFEDLEEIGARSRVALAVFCSVLVLAAASLLLFHAS
jgi:membrane associated rhomboid family serine protease